MAEVRAYGICALKTFAAEMEVDGTAVRAALTKSRNSGQAERQVNRLKILKWQSYGCASFEVLRRRSACGMIHAKCGRTTNADATALILPKVGGKTCPSGKDFYQRRPFYRPY